MDLWGALEAVVQHWPLDVRLPALPEARGQLVRYKPGRRAVLRLDGSYAKLRADGRAPVEIPGGPRVLEHRPDKVRRRVELARERLADYRRSASSVITAS